jgi:hypothetical protein
MKAACAKKFAKNSYFDFYSMVLIQQLSCEKLIFIFMEKACVACCKKFAKVSIAMCIQWFKVLIQRRSCKKSKLCLKVERVNPA